MTYIWDTMRVRLEETIYINEEGENATFVCENVRFEALTNSDWRLQYMKTVSCNKKMIVIIVVNLLQ